MDGLSLLGRLDGGDFPATLYVEGPSEPLKAVFLAEMRRAWAKICPEAPLARVFRPAEAGIEEILAAYQNTSLFSPRELVLVLDIQDVGRSEKRVRALADGVSRPASGSTLVLVESAADNPRKSLEPLRAACSTRWIAQPADRRALEQWAARRLRRDGLTADPGVLPGLVEACEGEALAFFNEIEKLCTLLGSEKGGAKLTREDVARVMRPVVGSDLPEYLAAVALGRPALAAHRLGRLLSTGVGEGLVLWSLSNMVGGALGGWARHRDLSMTLARRRPPRELGEVLDALYRAEAAWKGGRADPVAVLEQATREVCGAEAAP